MKQVNSYLLRSINDILRWNVLRFALLIGLPLMGLWVWLSMSLWDYAVAIASIIIGWVPFSIVKANGALFIIFFLWFVGVLASFAAMTVLVGPPLLRKFKQKTYYIYTFTLLLLFSTLWALVILVKWQYIFDEIQKLLTLLPFQTVADAFAWLLAFYFFYNAYILTLFLIISVFRKPFLEKIRLSDYPNVTIQEGGISKKHHGRVMLDMTVFVILSIIAFPILFIPIANVFMQIFLWSWLYRESYFLSTCNLYCEEEDYQHLRHHRFMIWSIAVLTSLFNFLPVINIFAPFFAQIMFFHWIMEHKTLKRATIDTKEETTHD
ncbi:EI24 domain-containing protein [Hydrogenimonas urashimensis]|uniref:EI24 domain-containing protein n=1 Tax=Hydrogenimonas urashimensis TaxID=2740515 RepID=UPI0019164D84|nr:EI24 domain-containing protein [Hydrogenimonas urashimensis]